MPLPAALDCIGASLGGLAVESFHRYAASVLQVMLWGRGKEGCGCERHGPQSRVDSD